MNRIRSVFTGSESIAIISKPVYTGSQAMAIGSESVLQIPSLKQLDRELYIQALFLFRFESIATGSKAVSMIRKYHNHKLQTKLH